MLVVVVSLVVPVSAVVAASEGVVEILDLVSSVVGLAFISVQV